MTDNIKFDGYKSHGVVKIAPFTGNNQRIHVGDTTEGYDDACMVNNDTAKSRNVSRDLKNLENHFNALCQSSMTEISQGNDDGARENGTFKNMATNMNLSYMKHQTEDLREQFTSLSQSGAQEETINDEGQYTYEF